MFTEKSNMSKKAGGALTSSVRKTTALRSGQKSEENATAVTIESLAPKPFSSSTKGNTLKHARLAGKAAETSKKPDVPHKTADKEIQVNIAEEELVTGDAPSLEYWKKLAEAREVELETVRSKLIALESKHEEMEMEHSRVKEENVSLRNEVNVMESMLEDAKKLAEYIQEMPDSDNDD